MIARIRKPQGLKGLVRVEVLFDDEQIFRPGRLVHVLAGATERTEEIEFLRWQHGRAVLKLRGIDRIEHAQELVGAEVRIPYDDIGPPAPGAFYTFQLKGCKVFRAAGEYLGVVADVLDMGGAQTLKVECDGKELLIPFVQAFMKKIDPDGKRIDVELPEGLLELN